MNLRSVIFWAGVLSCAWAFVSSFEHSGSKPQSLKSVISGRWVPVGLAMSFASRALAETRANSTTDALSYIGFGWLLCTFAVWLNLHLRKDADGEERAPVEPGRQLTDVNSRTSTDGRQLTGSN